MRVYRLTLTKFLESALSGEGARRYGGRWTPKGLPAIYTAQSIALAVLEQLVHMDTVVLNTLKHASIKIDIPEGVATESIDIDVLPTHWRSTPAPAELQAIGARWLEEGRSVALIVPSAVVPTEFNTILNPNHYDFSTLIVSGPEHFLIDPRLGHA